MPLEQTEAIVLRTFNVGEQDKIVVFFSRDRGILKGVAKGARKFGNRFGSSLEPLSLVKAHYYEKERKELKTGIWMAAKPFLKDEGENILLELGIEHTELLGWRENIPEVEVNSIQNLILIPNGRTVVMILPKSDGTNLICLVGAKKLDG